MEESWENMAAQYQELLRGGATSESLRSFRGRAASSLPRDSAHALSWFVSALQRSPQKWFVAAVMAEANPVPRTLLDPMVKAALLEPNPSSNRYFIDPCLRTFGAEQVISRINALSTTPGVAEHDGVRQVMYWVGQSSPNQSSKRTR